MSVKKPRVLFLCGENRARSQIAEAFLRHYAGDQFEVYSAGFDPSPIHPAVYEVMAEVGLDLKGHYSKGLDVFFNRVYFGILITLCQRAEEKCPTFPGLGERHYWPIEDPVKPGDSDGEGMEPFRRARDEIERHILRWLEDRKSRERLDG